MGRELLELYKKGWGIDVPASLEPGNRLLNFSHLQLGASHLQRAPVCWGGECGSQHKTGNLFI